MKIFQKEKSDCYVMGIKTKQSIMWRTMSHRTPLAKSPSSQPATVRRWA